jgi:hypothetical protein
MQNNYAPYFETQYGGLIVEAGPQRKSSGTIRPFREYFVGVRAIVVLTFAHALVPAADPLTRVSFLLLFLL